MSSTLPEIKTINFLQDSTLIPVIRNYYENWSIRSFFIERSGANSYLSPNRRDYYKVLMIIKGAGMYTIGTQVYEVAGPTVFFIPPSEIISWKSTTDQFAAYFCLFKRSFADTHPDLKAVIDKYRLFADKYRHALRLSEEQVSMLMPFFRKMQEADQSNAPTAHDTMQAYLQLLLLEGATMTDHPTANSITDEYKHIYRFFELLEKETAHINYTNPIRIKTAKEFADDLALTPNHLNALLKKYTGQQVSAHIKSRLLDESKALLLQTDWSVPDIGYAIGFANQANFTTFFKKLTGATPASFRKQHHR